MINLKALFVRIDIFGKKKLEAMDVKLQEFQEESAKKIQNLQISFLTTSRNLAESQQEKYAWMGKLNLKSLYILGYPLVFSFSIQGIYKYLPPNFYYLFIPGVILGVGVGIWWKWAKHFLFATDIKIIPEK